jgi:hypothetical protein
LFWNRARPISIIMLWRGIDMAGNFGYSPNKDTRTSSSGRRQKHGYNYRHLIQYCAELNREKDGSPYKHVSEIYETIQEAFE